MRKIRMFRALKTLLKSVVAVHPANGKETETMSEALMSFLTIKATGNRPTTCVTATREVTFHPLRKQSLQP